MKVTDNIRIPLPTTAQLNTVIEAVENAPAYLRPVMHPISWLRNRLDPLYKLEQVEAKDQGDGEGHSTTDSDDEDWVHMEAKRTSPADGEIVFPSTERSGKRKGATAAETPESSSRNLRALELDDKAKCRHRDNTVSLMGKTYQHEKLGLRPGQRPHHIKTEEDPKNYTSDPDRSAPTMNRTYQQENLGYAQTHQEPEDLEPETVEIPDISTDDPEPKVRLFIAEQERVTQDIQAAISTNHFKIWPLKPDLQPDNKTHGKIDESTVYQAPLDVEVQARKAQLMDEWKRKKERDIKDRKYPGRGTYGDDEMERRYLKSTDMFQPTLAPYIGTGKKIPTREEMQEENGSSEEYVDAVEVLPQASKTKATPWKKPNILDKRPPKSRPPTSAKHTDDQALSEKKGEEIGETSKRLASLDKNLPIYPHRQASKEREDSQASRRHRDHTREHQKKDDTSNKNLTNPRPPRQPAFKKDIDDLEEPAFAHRMITHKSC